MNIFFNTMLCFTCLTAFSQNATDEVNKQNIIKLNSGIGYSSIRHEYIDKDKYSGILVPLGIEWENQSIKNSWKVCGNFDFGNIKTKYDEADIINISLGFDLCYPIYEITVSKNDANLFIGPSTFIYVNSREQKRISLSDSNIVIGIWAIGPNIGIKGSISDYLHYSTMLRINILSYGGHDNISTSFLSFWKAFHSFYIFSLYWRVYKGLDLGIHYQFNYTHINKWPVFVAGSDFLLCSINFKL